MRQEVSLSRACGGAALSLFRRIGFAAPGAALVAAPLVGCAPDAAPALGDTAAAPADVDPGWDIGAVEPCAAPLAAAAWTDRSDLVDTADGYGGQRADEGEVALSRVDGEWELVASYPGGAPRRSSLDGSAPEPLEAPFPTGRITWADLDADGIDDLLMYSDGLAVRWGSTGEVAALQEPTGEREIFDLSVADFDGDGWLDVLAATLALHPPDEGEDAASDEAPPEIAWSLGGGQLEPLTPVTLDQDWGAAFDLSAIDWDKDGRLDAYVCNDGPHSEPDRVLCSRDRDFEVCDARGADLATFCMGATFGDLDRDGLLDLYLTASGAHHLLLDSDAGFVDVTAAALDVSFDGDQMGWGAAIVDLDNDGLPDLLSANGDFAMRDGHWPLWVFMQQEGGALVERGADLGFPHELAGRGLIARDLNADGVLDIVLGDMERPPWVWLSDGCTADAWLDVEAPAGSVVWAESGDQRWAALVTDDPGYGASAPPIAHLGLGAVTSVDRVRLVVPGGREVALEGPLEPRRRLRWRP